jgi:CheY-like chemotaxis protein
MNQKDATVFYVDDNAKSQRLLGSLITACGFRVITASNPLEAAGGPCSLHGPSI